MSQIDFNDLARSPQYQVSISTQRTLPEIENALLIERRKFNAMLLAVFGGAIFCMAVYGLSVSPDEKRWALGILQSIFIGGVFYGIGQNTAKWAGTRSGAWLGCLHRRTRVRKAGCQRWQPRL